MLKLNNITISFGHIKALENISCTIDDKDFIVIVGTNGAGKTTLFDVIAGKTTPNSGTIILDDKDITDWREIQRASFITRLFQTPRLNSVENLTVAQNLALASYNNRSASLKNGMNGMNRKKAKQLLEPLELDSDILLDKPMSALSGGQQQLIAFVMATLYKPRFLLLDEPTAALDPQAATKLLRYTSQFIKAHGITALMITHDPHIALHMGNKIWVLEQGSITKQYSQEEKQKLIPEQLIGQIDYAVL